MGDDRSRVCVGRSRMRATNLPLPFALDEPSAGPHGLILYREVLSAEEEPRLVADIERLTEPWERPVLRRGLPAARREMLCFGWDYVTQGRTLRRGAEIPNFLQRVLDQCAAVAKLDPRFFEQAIVTRYSKGAGINWHADAPSFGGAVM